MAASIAVLRGNGAVSSVHAEGRRRGLWAHVPLWRKKRLHRLGEIQDASICEVEDIQVSRCRFAGRPIVAAFGFSVLGGGSPCRCPAPNRRAVKRAGYGTESGRSKRRVSPEHDAAHRPAADALDAGQQLGSRRTAAAANAKAEAPDAAREPRGSN
jgi:hypothetical protein